ncbi:hypothetical protein Vau01_025740 [Virgisporangium aurantiacum]|uniref:Uncharacterized protein n=1 Tax=Virgisporangium aurantiacum TaxID=175570 RepID=A0A8J3Z4U1_9ACTN|nr:hypothetical protein Vau01_025740 [Virgisporangium aurantiacum]
MVGAVGGGGEVGIEAGLGERRPVQVGADGLLVVVDAVAERRVEVAQRRRAVLPLGGDGHPHRAERVLQPLRVPGFETGAPVVEQPQAHHVEAHLDVADALHLQQPSGRVPRPGALRVEPHVGDDHASSLRRAIGPEKGQFRHFPLGQSRCERYAFLRRLSSLTCSSSVISTCLLDSR